MSRISIRSEIREFAGVLSLRRLRYLGLHEWNLYTPHFYRVLANNAEHLEELRLTHCGSIVSKRLTRDETGKVRRTFMIPTETSVEEFEPMKKMCLSIRLGKVKTLHLDVERSGFPLAFYWLIRVVPALETALFGGLKESTAKELSLTLRKSCPRLRTVWQDNIRNRIIGPPGLSNDTALHLVSACTPGHLVHSSLHGWRIDHTYMEAMSVHRDSLETLELGIRDEDYQDSFDNLCTILERCSRLKHLAVYFPMHRRPSGRQNPFLFLNKLATCPGLESLAFHGFIFPDDDYFDDYVYESDDDFRSEYDSGSDDDSRSDEGTWRVSCDLRRKFGDYELKSNIFHTSGWRELHLGIDDGFNRGECSDQFERLVGDAIGSLSSLKRVVFGCKSYVKVHSSSSKEIKVMPRTGAFDADRDLDEVIHDDFGEEVGAVKCMVEQYLKSAHGEVPPSAAVLPHGWKYINRPVAGINTSASNNKFRKMAFDVIGTLPAMNCVVLNSDMFEKV
ncbi:hypothetical protein BGZ88_003540 [Linnemannia elongata]|nr:hypothetical protein BGZ88_003540 [Linnemannia elongata]